MNIYNINLKKEVILNYFLLVSVTSFIFFSGLKYEYFQLRLIILFLFFISIYKFYNSLKEKDFRPLKVFLFIFLLLISHFVINLNNENYILTSHVLFGYIFFYIIFIVSYFHTLEINQQLNKILLIFYITLLISSLIGILLMDHSRSPIFCGGLPVYYDFFNKLNFYLPFNYIKEIYLIEGPNGASKLSSMKLTFDEFLFNENSHLGMIAPGCIIFSLYQISKNKTNIWFKILFFLFIIICILKNSTTLMLGTICSLIFLILFNYKYFSKKLMLLFVLIIFSFSSIIYFSQECNSRLIPFYYNDLSTEEMNKILSNKKVSKNEQIDKKKFIGNLPNEIFISIGIEKKYAYMISNFFHKETKLSSGSLSSAAYYNALSVALKSIIDKPLGWGINGYENAYKFYHSKVIDKNININFYNTKDGTNNFVKIIVEFGVFGILFYFSLIIINYSKLLPIEYKLIYIPIIITQSIRGAGYFNGGFILIVFLLLFSYIKFHKHYR